MKKIASTTAKHAFIPATLTVIVLVASSCQKQELKQPVTAQAATEATADELSIQNNLVAWYPFNGNTKDSSGNANDVIFSNATPAAGADGTENTAYAFNGVDNYMRVKNNRTLSPGREITIYALVNVSGFYHGSCHNNRIVNKGLNDADEGVYYLQFNDAFFYDYNQCLNDVDLTHQTFGGTYGNGTGNTGDAIDSTNRIKIDKWYPVAYTYDGVSAKFYVNGALVYAKQAVVPFNSNKSDLFIGMSNIDNTTYPDWFAGRIDDIKIYKKALTAKQIKKLTK